MSKVTLGARTAEQCSQKVPVALGLLSLAVIYHPGTVFGTKVSVHNSNTRQLKRKVHSHTLTHTLVHTHINYHCNVGPPKLKDTAFVDSAARRAVLGGYEHYLGQKGLPLFSNLPNYCYESMNVVDWMHNLAGLFKWWMKTFVGPLGDQKGSAKQYRQKADALIRRQLKANGVFPSLWDDAPQYLDQRKTNLLRNMSPDMIDQQSASWCRRWWKACGTKVPKGTRVATLRSQVHKWRDYLVDNPRQNIVVSRGKFVILTLTLTLIHPPHPHSYSLSLLGCKPLPWQLPLAAVNVVDKRVLNIVYPHGINGCSKDGISFFKKSGRTWRTADKITALLSIIPTVTRDYIPAARAGFKKVIWGLRILSGRCVCGAEAVRMRIQRGSRPLVEGDTDRARELIVEGFSILEGMYVDYGNG